MQSILWQWRSLAISSYTAMMMLGLIAALLIGMRETRRQHVRLALFLDALLAAVTIGILTARWGYVLINWSYFRNHTAEILRLWQGGLSWQFGLVGGSIGAWLIAQRHAAPWRIMDILALGTTLSVCFGWIGSYLSATAFGRELYPGDTFFFLASDTPDWYGLANPRWPTQLLGALWAALLFAGLWLTRHHSWRDGVRCWFFIAAYSLGAALLGFTRGDDITTLGGWRVDQLLDALLFLVGLVQLFRFSRSHQPPTPVPLDVPPTPQALTRS